MSSEDVIELGSSDEETQPAPKKRKLSSNVMVQFPNKLPGLTIKKAKSGSLINPVSIDKGTAKIGKSVTISKVANLIANPYAKNKLNGNAIKAHPPRKLNPQPTGNKNVSIPISKHIGEVQFYNPQVVKNVGINPSKNIQINTSIANKSATGLNPISVVKHRKHNNMSTMNISNIKTTLKKSNLYKSNFPPGLTIRKTSALTKNITTRPCQNNKSIPFIAHGIKPLTRNSCNEVLTVDLDDDEPKPSGSGAKWYLQPEDQNIENTEGKIVGDSVDESVDTVPQSKGQCAGTVQQCKDHTKKSPEKDLNEIPISTQKSLKNQPLSTSESSSLEQLNNKEPEEINFIEITIEDSPMKPIEIKKGFKVGAELAITIDDSPIKGAADKIPPESGSEGEQIKNTKERYSKKKLKYPREVHSKVIEIEIEPIAVVPSSIQPKVSESQEIRLEKKIFKPAEVGHIVEIEESPLKPSEIENEATPKKNEQLKPQVKVTDIDSLNELQGNEKKEFQPAYWTFIDLCFKLENSEDMEKIVEKKIKSYYRQVPKEYTESEAFTEIVLSKVAAMKASPEKMYLFIKDIVDELDVQRKLAKSQAEAKIKEQEKFLYGEESEFDSKRQRQIRKLEKTLKKLHRAIQKLEEQEVDFDDEEDSVYLLTERYKERMVRVHAKLCQLTNTKMPSEPRIQIDARPGQPKGPAKRLEKWVNKKVPIGKPLPFPDFHDVLRCVREANQQDKLGWNDADIMEEARDLFTRCGRKLQRRRQENEWRLAASRISMDVDPAAESEDLQKKLEENTRMGAKKFTEVLNKYADRQKQLKLEGVEIGDKEAEESPVESDDEEPPEDNKSLENKHKRRERLKRLLHEKSKKSSDKKKYETESHSDIGNKDNENQEENKQKDNNSDLLQNPVKVTDIDSVELEISKDKENTALRNASKSDKVHSLSEDSNQVDSDIDELHLLQKLHSDNEVNSSTQDSSDSDSPICISDASISSDSSYENKKPAKDVISIENSSYSESEERKDEDVNEQEKELQGEEVEQPADSTNVKDCPDVKNKSEIKANNDKQLLEEILLASSDSENEAGAESLKDGPDIENINLRDDDIPIGETIEDIQHEEADSHVKDSNEDTNENVNTDSTLVKGVEISTVEMCPNLRDENIGETNIGETVFEDIQNEDNESCKNDFYEDANENGMTDSSSIESMEFGSVETCLNLRDDNISIGETIIEDIKNTKNNVCEKDLHTDKNANTDSSSIESMELGIVETCLNVRDDNISIGDTVIENRENESCGIDLNKDINKDANTGFSSIENIEINTAECEKQNRTEGNVNIKSLAQAEIAETLSIHSAESEEGLAVESVIVKLVEDNNGNSNDFTLNATETHLIETTINTVKTNDNDVNEIVLDNVQNNEENIESTINSVETHDGNSNQTTSNTVETNIVETNENVTIAECEKTDKSDGKEPKGDSSLETMEVDSWK